LYTAFRQQRCRLAKQARNRIWFGLCSFLAYRCFALIETISSIVALINLWPLQANPECFGSRFRGASAKCVRVTGSSIILGLMDQCKGDFFVGSLSVVFEAVRTTFYTNVG